MNIMRFEPWRLMGNFHREFDQVFGDSQPNAASAVEKSALWAPAVDVHEEHERFTVHADLPGVQPGDIQVTADKGVLTIRGSRRIEKRDSQKGYERLERIEGDFLRRFTLPENARAEEITARHSNGVLEVVIPKQAAVEPRRVNVEVN
jgi:HSP20 family protein